MDADGARTMLAWVTRREAERDAADRERLEALRAEARRLARLLTTRFHVEEVYLFGSAARGEPHARMDLDLAVRGLAFERYLEALAALLEAAPCDVDLVRLEEASPTLVARVEAEGVRLDVG